METSRSSGPNVAETGALKRAVSDHWERETCGTRYGDSSDPRRYYGEIEAARYRLEPYIPAFARFAEARGRQVLEIGVGAGSDFHQWVKSGARATGVDLTHAAIEQTREHLRAFDADPDAYRLEVGDAEHLRFPDDSFDLVYSWGVLHHSPDTPQAFREVRRVLRPGGTFRGMVYHVPSWTGWMVWAMQSLLHGRPFRSVKRSLLEHLESPGTKAYGLRECRELLEDAGFVDVRLETRLGPGDLLTIRPSDKYGGRVHALLFRLYPRWLVRLLGDRFGLYLLIEARAPA